MTTGVTFDSENDELGLGTNLAKINPGKVNIFDLAEEESNRIQTTASIAADALHHIPQKRFNDQLDESKLSEIPPVAVKVTDAAQRTLLTPTPSEGQETIFAIAGKNTSAPIEENPMDVSTDVQLQTALAQLAAQTEILADESIPLPTNLDAELTVMLGAKATPTEKRGFLIQINELVADIMKLISQLNDRDRQKNDHMKKEYAKLNSEIASAIQSRGNINAWSNIGAFVTRIVAFGLSALLIKDPNHREAIQKIGDMFGQQIPGMASLFTTKYEVAQTLLSNRISLINTEMQGISSKSGDNSGWKNELIQSLNDIKQWMTAAARSN